MNLKKSTSAVRLLFALAIGWAATAAANPALSLGTWVNVGPSQVPFGSGPFTQGMAIDPTNPNILYLCVSSFDVSQAGLFKTSDGGSTWKRIGEMTKPIYTGEHVLNEPIRLRIDPKNPQHLYCGNGVRGIDGFYVSNDGGQTFTMPQSFEDWGSQGGNGTLDVYDVAVDPTDFNHVLLSFHSQWRSGPAGILESKDGGTTWIEHGGPQDLGVGHSIAFLYKPGLNIGNSSTWLWGTQGPGYWRTTDAGAHWTKVCDAGIQHGGGSIYYTKAGTLYASGADRCLRSTDNGSTFTSIGPSGGFNAIWGDGAKLYTMKCFGPLPYQTASEADGATWTDFNTQQFSQGPFEMAVDETNRILYTASWTAGMWALKLPPQTTGISAQPRNAQAIRTAGSVARIVMGSSTRYSLSSNGDRAFDIQGKRISQVNGRQIAIVRLP